MLVPTDLEGERVAEVLDKLELREDSFEFADNLSSVALDVCPLNELIHKESPLFH